ncbi:unnamed protein product [Linum tenue]|nr:unnamed protein product [Linum tenue]
MTRSTDLRRLQRARRRGYRRGCPARRLRGSGGPPA